MEDGIVISGCDAGFDLATGQGDFAILADELPIRPDERGDVVNRVAVLLDQTGNDVDVVFLGEFAEISRAGAWNGLCAFVHLLPVP